MKQAFKILASQSFFAGCFCCVFFVIWIGVFFGVTYPEIIIKETYLPTTCTVLNSTVVSLKCCFKDCTYCSSCGGGTTCDSLTITLPINETKDCCDGYRCCDTCCDTCKTCSKGKCTSHSCNCRCCKSVSDRLCTLSCKQCWNPTIYMEYLTTSNATVISSMKKECSYDYSCVDAYIAAWPINSTSTCYYNPSNTMQFATTNEYTPYKFGIMYTFVGLTGISIIWFTIPVLIVIGYFAWKYAPDLTTITIDRNYYTTSDNIATTEKQVDINENAAGTGNEEIPLEVLQNPIIEKKPEPVYQQTGEVAENMNVGEKSVDIATATYTLPPPQESENSTTEVPVVANINTVIEEPSTVVIENQSSQVNYDIPYISYLPNTSNINEDGSANEPVIFSYPTSQ